MPDPTEDFFKGNLPPAEPQITSALNEDGSFSSHGAGEDLPEAQFRAARRGAALLLSGTTGGLAMDPNSLPEVRIGDAAAKVISNGWSPDSDGVWQIKVVVPDTVPASLQAHVTVIYGGQEWDSIDIAVE